MDKWIILSILTNTSNNPKIGNVIEITINSTHYIDADNNTGISSDYTLDSWTNLQNIINNTKSLLNVDCANNQMGINNQISAVLQAIINLNKNISNNKENMTNTNNILILRLF